MFLFVDLGSGLVGENKPPENDGVNQLELPPCLHECLGADAAVRNFRSVEVFQSYQPVDRDLLQLVLAEVVPSQPP